MHKYLMILFAALILGGFVVPARANASRLVVLGDSLSRGLYASTETGGYKYHLAELLQMELDGTSGHNTAGVLALLKENEWQADVLVIEIGLNDVGPGRINGREFRRLYNELVIEAIKDGKTVVLCTMFRINPLDKYYQEYEYRNNIIRRLARLHGVVLADLDKATKDCGECVSNPMDTSPFAPGYQGDNFHPSDYGHRVIAETIYRALWGGAVFAPLVGSFGSTE